MNRHTTAQVRNKDTSLTVSSHDTDAPLLPMTQIERLVELLPDKVDWVFEQAAAEGAFRRSETKRVNTLVAMERLGSMLSGLIIGCVALGISAYLSMNGHDVVAGVIGGTTVVGLVSAFVYSQQKGTGQQPTKQTSKK